MRFRQLFASLAIVLTLSVMFLSTSTFATGEEEPELPDQSQETEDAEDTGNSENTEEKDDANNSNSSDKTSIGGGLNADNEDQPSVTEKPTQPETPSVSKPLPQPEDADKTDVSQSTKPTASGAPVKPTLPTAILKPQAQTSKPTNSAVVSEKPTAGTPETEEPQVVPAIIPTAPSDSVAPVEIETPHTGAIESQKAPVNLFAVILLALSAITIITAGIVSIFLSKAAKRGQTAI